MATSSKCISTGGPSITGRECWGRVECRWCVTVNQPILHLFVVLHSTGEWKHTWSLWRGLASGAFTIIYTFITSATSRSHCSDSTDRHLLPGCTGLTGSTTNVWEVRRQDAKGKDGFMWQVEAVDDVDHCTAGFNIIVRVTAFKDTKKGTINFNLGLVGSMQAKRYSRETMWYELVERPNIGLSPTARNCVYIGKYR